MRARTARGPIAQPTRKPGNEILEKLRSSIVSPVSSICLSVGKSRALVSQLAIDIVLDQHRSRAARAGAVPRRALPLGRVAPVGF